MALRVNKKNAIWLGRKRQQHAYHYCMTTGSFSKEYNTQSSLKVDISQTVTINLGPVTQTFGWVKTLEWQAQVQLPSRPTPRIFLIVIVLHTFFSPLQMSRHCSLLKRLSHSRFIWWAVDVSVDCRSTYRPLCRSRVDRVSSECRSRVGRYIGRVDLSTDQPAVGRDSIGSVSAMYRWIVGRYR